MNRFTFVIIALTFALLGVVLITGEADADQVEPPTHEVGTVWVTYIEPIPTTKNPRRLFMETNDGAAYVFRTYRHCANTDHLAIRLCKTAFWYAR